MHSNRLACLLCVLALAAAAPVAAQAPSGSSGSSGSSATRSVRFLSAGDLHQRLSSSEPAAVEAGRHYIMGVLDTLMLVKDPQVCVGPNERLGELVDAVRAALAASPQLHRFNAGSFVREVIYTHLKCA